jgi:hypothetical protein
MKPEVPCAEGSTVAVEREAAEEPQARQGRALPRALIEAEPEGNCGCSR